MNRPVLAVVIVLIVVGGALAYYYLQPTGTETIEFAGQRLKVELAKTASQQEKGLSDRPSIPSDHGMLFVFSQPGKTGFWMQGMEFPLDIIWFDSNRTVIYLEQDLPPCTPVDCPTYTPPSGALYVLEVNAGFVALYNVTVGESFSVLG